MAAEGMTNRAACNVEANQFIGVSIAMGITCTVKRALWNCTAVRLCITSR